MKLKLFIPALTVIFVLAFSACSFKKYDCRIDFKSTKAYIDDAKEQKAHKFAPDYMKLSEKEFLRARKDLKNGDCERAQGWARRSAVDAELAKEFAQIEYMKSELKNLGQE